MIKKLFTLIIAFTSTAYSMEYDNQTFNSELKMEFSNVSSLKNIVLKKLGELDTDQKSSYKNIPGELIESIFEYKDLHKLRLLLKRKAKSPEIFKPCFEAILAQCLEDKDKEPAVKFDRNDLISLFLLSSRKLLHFGAGAILNHFIKHEDSNEYLLFVKVLIQLINTTKIARLDLNHSAQSLFAQAEKDLYLTLESSTTDITQIDPSTCYGLNVKPFPLAALFQADIEILKFLLKKGAQINDKDIDDYSAAHYIASQKAKAIVLGQWLIENNLDMQIISNGLTPLGRALEFKNFYLAQKILESIPKSSHETTCAFALAQVIQGKLNNIDAIIFLLERKAPINNYTIAIVIKNFLKCPELFYLIARLNLNPKWLDFSSLFAYALKADKESCLREIILSNPTLLSKKDSKSQTLLSAACEVHSSKTDALKLIIFILDRGSDVDVRNEDGTTPLMVACKLEKIDIVELLLKHKANPHLETNFFVENAPSTSARQIANENRNKSANFKTIYYLISKKKKSFFDMF